MSPSPPPSAGVHVTPPPPAEQFSGRPGRENDAARKPHHGIAVPLDSVDHDLNDLRQGALGVHAHAPRHGAHPGHSCLDRQRHRPAPKQFPDLRPEVQVRGSGICDPY